MMLRPEIAPTRTLDDVIEHFALSSGTSDPAAAPLVVNPVLTGVTLNSSDVRPGELFVGLGGVNGHGANYVEQAAANGAVAILTDAEGAELASTSPIPVVVSEDPRGTLGAVSAFVYDTVSATPVLFGITGTNGKTSTVHMVEAILRQLGLRAGLSSTAERHIGDLSVTSGLTTPESTELHALLARMREDEVDAAAIEVSAQALTRHRVDGVVFDVAGFTNLTHDHLDDYGTMEAYFAAKLPLFTPERSRRGVVSLDSPYGARVVEAAGVPVSTITSLPDVDADWRVTVLDEDFGRVYFEVAQRDGRSIRTSIPIIGRHMAANAGLAIAMIVESGRPLAELRAALHRDGGIDAVLPGRTERVSGDRGPTVYVDFGHSPDAFENTLAAVRRVTPGRVIMLFGADGDRDTLKRPAMAGTAVLGSDILVITDHHPRFEDPASIRATLVAEARKARPDADITEVGDPKLAIRVAVGLAREGDAILWAGPGHQNYRDIEGTREPYSARAEARAALAEAGWADAPAEEPAGDSAGDSDRA